MRLRIGSRAEGLWSLDFRLWSWAFGFDALVFGFDFGLSPRSGREHKAWGGARLCERNPRIVAKHIRAREAGDRPCGLRICRPLRGLDLLTTPLPGVSLAKPRSTPGFTLNACFAGCPVNSKPFSAFLRKNLLGSSRCSQFKLRGYLSPWTHHLQNFLQEAPPCLEKISSQFAVHFLWPQPCCSSTAPPIPKPSYFAFPTFTAIALFSRMEATSGQRLRAVVQPRA